MEEVQPIEDVQCRKETGNGCEANYKCSCDRPKDHEGPCAGNSHRSWLADEEDEPRESSEPDSKLISYDKEPVDNQLEKDEDAHMGLHINLINMPETAEKGDMWNIISNRDYIARYLCTKSYELNSAGWDKWDAWDNSIPDNMKIEPICGRTYLDGAIPYKCTRESCHDGPCRGVLIPRSSGSINDEQEKAKTETYRKAIDNLEEKVKIRLTSENIDGFESLRVSVDASEIAPGYGVKLYKPLNGLLCAKKFRIDDEKKDKNVN